MSTRRGWHVSGAVLCVVAVAAVFASCGRKTNPVAPELVVPVPIHKLTASNSHDGVVLNWERPPSRVGKTRLNDLGGFRVFRSLGDGPFEIRATLDVEDLERFQQVQKFRYLDADVSMEVAYRYMVRSVTTDGYVSDDSNIVEITRLLATPSPANVATPTVR